MDDTATMPEYDNTGGVYFMDEKMDRFGSQLFTINQNFGR
jgi:hypothetical protein